MVWYRPPGVAAPPPVAVGWRPTVATRSTALGVRRREYTRKKECNPFIYCYLSNMIRPLIHQAPARRERIRSQVR